MQKHHEYQVLDHPCLIIWSHYTLMTTAELTIALCVENGPNTLHWVLWLSHVLIR